MRPAARTEEQQQLDRQRHDEMFQRLRDAKLIDAEGNPTAEAADDSTLDAETVSFLHSASETLGRVMQHDGKDVFHFKALVTRAKQLLAAGQFADAAPLFKEATRFYFLKLREPYAAIADSRSLGRTIEERLAKQVAKEKAEKGESEGRSIAAQFRMKELDNLPHVHTALLEYAKTLKQNKVQMKRIKQQQKNNNKKNKGASATPNPVPKKL
jgi:hypothetical protein